jgi:2Fe-2S ferredoxin
MPCKGIRLKNTLQALKQRSLKVPKIIILPHEELCPDGMVVEAEPGQTICDVALQNHVEIEHACEKSCACTTCHVYVREGMESLNENTEDEDDMLDKAWGLDPDSRLSCQAIIGEEDLVIEIPKYTINMVSENH